MHVIRVETQLTHFIHGLTSSGSEMGPLLPQLHGSSAAHADFPLPLTRC